MELKGGIDLCPSSGQFSNDNIIVLKIGGSCLKNGISLRKSLEKVYACIKEGYRPIIVLSALNGLTDRLLNIVNSNVSVGTETSDSILSEGELLSARIINKILKYKNHKSKIIDIYQDDFPIITTEDDGKIKIDLVKTKSKLRSTLNPLIVDGIIPIIPGFIGKTKKGNITTLGRGGSDTTAVLVGSLVNAYEIILLKDVPGILSCDPKINSSEKIIDQINVHRAIELGLNGGEVINPDALKYKNEETDLRIVDYDNDNFLEEGTKITGCINFITETNIHDSKVLVSLVSHSDNNKISKYKNISYNRFEEPLCSFSSEYTYSMCIEENDLKNTVNHIHDIIRKNDEDIAIGYEKEIFVIEIKSNYLLNFSNIHFKIYRELNKNSISILNSKFESNELFIVVKNENDKKLKNFLKVIK